MKKSRFIPAFLLSAALLSGLAGCKKETEYYNPNAQTSSVTETQTELQTEQMCIRDRALLIAQSFVVRIITT